MFNYIICGMQSDLAKQITGTDSDDAILEAFEAEDDEDAIGAFEENDDYVDCKLCNSDSKILAYKDVDGKVTRKD